MFIDYILYGLIVLHGVGGYEIYIIPEQITSLRVKPPDGSDPNDLFVKGVHCMVNFVDGKFVTTVETCQEIRDAIIALEEKSHGKPNGGRPESLGPR